MTARYQHEVPRLVEEANRWMSELLWGTPAPGVREVARAWFLGVAVSERRWPAACMLRAPLAPAPTRSVKGG